MEFRPSGSFSFFCSDFMMEFINIFYFIFAQTALFFILACQPWVLVLVLDITFC